MLVISAPSGAGKTSLCRAAVEKIPDLTHSISYTTRSPRQGEVDGRDYYFIDEEAFCEMDRKGEFIEWARVHGNLYGTSKRVLEEIQNKGSDVILDIDAQGAQKLMLQTALKAVYVFVVTPNFSELEKRLCQRDSDSDDEIQKRLKRAREEIAEFYKYDYLLVNDEFDEALENLVSILKGERCSVKCVDHHWLKQEFFEE